MKQFFTKTECLTGFESTPIDSFEFSEAEDEVNFIALDQSGETFSITSENVEEHRKFDKPSAALIWMAYLLQKRGL